MPLILKSLIRSCYNFLNGFSKDIIIIAFNKLPLLCEVLSKILLHDKNYIMWYSIYQCIYAGLRLRMHSDFKNTLHLELVKYLKFVITKFRFGISDKAAYFYRKHSKEKIVFAHYVEIRLLLVCPFRGSLRMKSFTANTLGAQEFTTFPSFLCAKKK